MPTPAKTQPLVQQTAPPMVGRRLTPPTPPPTPLPAEGPLEIDASKEGPQSVPAPEPAPKPVALETPIAPPPEPAPHPPQYFPPKVEEEPPTMDEAQAAALAAMASNPQLKENDDGSIDITLLHPVSISHLGIPPDRIAHLTDAQGRLVKLHMQRCVWRHRREAARRAKQNATMIDHDTLLMCVLCTMPENVIDEIDGRDMSVVQAALGKLLYSPQMLSAT